MYSAFVERFTGKGYDTNPALRKTTANNAVTTTTIATVISTLRFLRVGASIVDGSGLPIPRIVDPINSVVASRPVVWEGVATFGATAGRYGTTGVASTGGGIALGGAMSGTGPVGDRGPVGAGSGRAAGGSVISSI
jgi:hypothetical protein